MTKSSQAKPTGFSPLNDYCIAVAVNLDTSVAGVLKPTKTVGPRVATGTSSAPNVNDNNPATFIAPPLNDLSAAGVASRLITSINFGTPVNISRVEVSAKYDNDLPGFGIYYSNDGTNWTQYGSNITVTTVQATHQRDVFVTAQYIAFMAAPAQFSGTAVTIYDINAYSVIPANMTVASTSFTATSVPSTMKALIQVKENETAVAGTDYTLECSRDGGTTWSAMTLTEKFTTPAGQRVVEAALTDVTGQPSGTAPRWRFKTFNNKDVELHGTYFEWK